MEQKNIKSKIINQLIKNGKKEHIEKFLKNVLFNIKQTNNQEPITVLHKLVVNLSPKFIDKTYAKNTVLNMLKKNKQTNNGIKFLLQDFIKINKKNQKLNINLDNNSIIAKKTNIYKSAEKFKYNK